MINLLQKPLWASLVVAGAALAGASAGAAPVVSFAQAIADETAPCGTLGLCVVPASVASARTAWLTSVTGATFEEFETSESRVKDAPALFAGTATLSSSATGSGFYDEPMIGNTFLGRFNTTGGGGQTGWWFEFGPGTATILFSAPVEAFGFYLTDLGDEGGSASITLSNNQQVIAGGQSILIAPSGGGLLSGSPSVLFFGVKADGTPFDSVTFSITGTTAADFVGLDSLIIGNVETVTDVPTPGTLTLALAGLALLGRLRTRRST